MYDRDNFFRETAVIGDSDRLVPSSWAARNLILCDRIGAFILTKRILGVGWALAPMVNGRTRVPSLQH